MKGLDQLAKVIRQKNAVEDGIARIIGRPALIGHTGEYIAANVFDIKLEQSASCKDIDGHFTAGELAGKTVNIKWYAKQEGLLDISPKASPPPDFYLVMTGPKAATLSSKGMTRPWIVTCVSLFDARELVKSLVTRGVRIGIATSVRRELWDRAEIYPTSRNKQLVLSKEEKEMLDLFG